MWNMVHCYIDGPLFTYMVPTLDIQSWVLIPTEGIHGCRSIDGP